MTRAQILALLTVLVLVGGGFWFLSSRLPKGRAVKPGTPPRAASGPSESPVDPPSPVTASSRRPVEFWFGTDDMRVVGADSSPMRAPGQLHPMFTRAASEVWVGLPGRRWERVAFPVPGGQGRFGSLAPSAPTLTLRLREADGSPARDVPVSFYSTSPGPTAWEGHRTNGEGVVLLDDRPAGVLRVRVGGSERAGPTLRLVAGRDREATATLEPPFLVTGRVLAAEGGAPVAGATVLGFSDEGRNGAPVVTGADGTFRWAGRFTEEVSLVVRARGFEDVAVEPALPDPRGALLATVEARLPRASPSVSGRAERRDAWFDVAVEPSVLAPLREWYGPDAVLGEAARTRPGDDGAFAVAGLPSGVPLRASVRGDVVPEDHLVEPGSPLARDLRVSPEPSAPVRPAGEAPAAGAAPAAPPAPATPGFDATLSGRVVDAAGKGLRGLTVGGKGSRTTTGEDGAFTLSGLRAGEAVDLVIAWLDGAEPGDAVPGAFAPYHETTARAGGKPVAITFPKAAAVTFRVVDGRDDRPLSWARVVIEDGDGRLRFDGPLALRDGRATLTDLTPTTSGRMTVLATGLRAVARVVLDAGRTADLGDVRMTAGGTVEGEVVDRDGKPVPGAEVALVEDGWIRANPRRASVFREYAVRRTRADARGAWRLAGLDPGRREAIAAWAPGYAPTARLVLWVEGRTDRLVLVLTKGAELRIRATEKDGTPVSGANIDLESARHGARWLDLVRRAALGGAVGSTEDVRRASSMLLLEDPKAPGQYRVGPVEPGPYELLVVRPGFKTRRTTLTLPDPAEPVAWRLVQGIEWPVQLEPE